MKLHQLKYACLTCLKHVFSVLLSVSFLLSNGPAKGMLLPKNEVLTETSFSGKRQQQLLVADVDAQFEMDEQDRTEEPSGDSEGDGLLSSSSIQILARTYDIVNAANCSKDSVHAQKVPLYILQHSWKTFLPK